MAERTPILASLRLRLFVGAAVIAGIAIFAAILAARGTIETARMIEKSAAAQARIALLSGLSARVRDYAVVAVEAAQSDVPASARADRLESLARRVDVAMASVNQALGSAVSDASGDGEEAQMRLATRSLGLARMRAQFEALHKAVLSTGRGPRLRATPTGCAR